MKENAGSPFFTRPRVLPDLYPTPEPVFDVRRPIVRTVPAGIVDGSAAQQVGAPHNDQAAKSQNLVFLSRHGETYIKDA
jgi:hypothetical protein